MRAYGVRVALDGGLLVPLRDDTRRLWNVQRIAASKPANGIDKRFAKGGRKSGLWHELGETADAEVILIAEGYATAASVHEATGRPAVVAFDAGNLAPVAKALRKLYPRALLVVCGDDDRASHEKKGVNPGRDKATTAAKAVRGTAAFPAPLPDGATDFNDLYLHAGLDAVRDLIETAIARTQVAQQSAADQQYAAEPSPARSDRFRVDGDGLWYTPPSDDGDGKPRRVCGPIKAIAMARDAKDNAAALVLEFDTQYSRGRRWLMPLALLAGDGTTYRSALLNQGFLTPSDMNRRRWLTEYLSSRQELELVRHVPRVGWHGRCYVLPNETLGERDGDPIIFHSEKGVEVNIRQRGTLADWQTNLAARCIGNTRLGFAVSTAFAGPLLAWASGTTGGGFHYFGPTSTGKTTGLLIAASVWGKGAEKDPEAFMQGWKSTDNGLEGQAEQHNDLTLVLDELGQMDPGKAGEAAYMLADGMGKTRMAQAGGQRPKATWRLLYLSSGELTLAQHMDSVGKKMHGGQEVRLIPIPAEVTPGTALDSLQDFASGHAFSNFVQAHSARTYGTAGRAWLEYLTANTDTLRSRLRSKMEAIESSLSNANSVGQVKRAGRRFALVAAAGELATEAGLTGWPPGEATRSVRTCFEAWLTSRGGAGSSDEIHMVRQVRHFLQANGDGRFAQWERADDDHQPKTLQRVGFRRKTKDSVDSNEASLEYYVLSEPFRKEVCTGFDYKAVCRVLIEHGCMVVEPGRLDVNMRLPGGSGTQRCYRITSKIFELDV